MRVPQSLLVGLMWFDPDRPDPLARLRHLAQERDGAPLRPSPTLAPKSFLGTFKPSPALLLLATGLSVQLLPSCRHARMLTAGAAAVGKRVHANSLSMVAAG